MREKEEKGKEKRGGQRERRAREEDRGKMD